jgi:hypothetical protein
VQRWSRVPEIHKTGEWVLSWVLGKLRKPPRRPLPKVELLARRLAALDESLNTAEFDGLARLPEVVLLLHREPPLGAGREGLGEPGRHHRAHPGAAVEYLGQGFARDAQCLGGLGDAQFERFQAELANDFAGAQDCAWS